MEGVYCGGNGKVIVLRGFGKRKIMFLGCWGIGVI